MEEKIIGSCCVAAEDINRIKKIVAGEPKLKDNLEFIPGVGTLSIFPHHSNLKLLGLSFYLLGGQHLPLYGMASSISSLTFITDYLQLDKAVSILLEKFWADSGLSNIDKRIDLETQKNFHLTSPVELISFQGPHFGDRYGIAHTAFKTLDDQGIPTLVTACSGAAVYIVLPEKKLQEARPLLAEAFEAP
jgi:aspartokinase